MFSKNPKSKPKDAAVLHAQDGDIVIPIIGASGVGKSSFVNSLLKSFGHPTRATVGDTLISCTTHLEPFVVKLGDDRRVVLIDTPGLDDTEASDTDILKGVADWLRKTYRRKNTSLGVVYLHDITQDRITGSARANIHKLNKQCSAASLDKVVLVTSKWARDSGGIDLEGREETLKSDHWGSMVNRANGARVMRLRAGEEEASAFEVVDSIVKRVDAEAETEALREVEGQGRIRQMISKFLSNAKVKMHGHDQRQGATAGEAVWLLQEDAFNRDETDQDERFRDAEGKLSYIAKLLRNLCAPFCRRLQRWLVRA